MKKKIRFRSMAAIGTMLGVMLLVFWSLLMFWLTREEAYNFKDIMYMQAETFADEAVRYSPFGDSVTDVFERERNTPGILDESMLDIIRYGNYEAVSQIRGEERYHSFPVQTAIIFYDKEDNELMRSGNYLYFSYVTEKEWDGNINSSLGNRATDRYGWINLNNIELADLGEDNEYDVIFTTTTLRIMGKWNENELIPAKIDYCDVDESDYWTNIYSNPNLANEKELDTIYGYSVDWTSYPDYVSYDEGNSVDYKGKSFENLLEYMDYFVRTPDVGLQDGARVDDLDCFIMYDTFYFYDETIYGLNPEIDEAQLSMITMYMGYPWQMAVTKLTKLYIITFIALFFIWLVLYRTIRDKIVIPLQEVNQGIADGFKHIPQKASYDSLWKEMMELRNHFFETGDKLRMLKNENNRLEAALAYSKEAEETRRQMTSNIAHELKTPLAIIHSYSEGLKEQIADDKKDEYYDVILSETERMDAMVLEMLDLSRLEAGKVKLARDEFSLSLMVQSVFEVLSTLASGKGLDIELDMNEEFVVHADEGRIYQVVSNFVSNAIRYTSEGGVIKAKVYKRRGATVFAIENTSKPFTKEELTKIWDTFYRTDKSRNSKGTGLGLAIAKNIIHLHGGSCSVKNTEIGVEFQFLLLD